LHRDEEDAGAPRLRNHTGAFREQAVEKVHTQDFDLLISDIGLPDRSGYELMREVRSSKALPGIALSGFGAEQDVNEATLQVSPSISPSRFNFERWKRQLEICSIPSRPRNRDFSQSGERLRYGALPVGALSVVLPLRGFFNSRESFSTR